MQLLAAHLQFDIGPVAAMPTSSACLLVLLGIGLFSLDRPGLARYAVTEVTALTLVIASMLVLLGYLYEVEGLYGVDSSIPMALLSALSFQVFAWALLLAGEQGPLSRLVGRRAVLLPRLQIPMIGAVILFGWLSKEARRLEWLSPAMIDALHALAAIIALTALVAWAGWHLQKLNQAREGLREELQRFFQMTPDMFAVAGTDGYFKRINPAMSAALGHSTDDLLRRPFLDFVHPDDRDDTLQQMQRIKQGERCLRFRNRYRRADNQYRWLSWHAQLVEDQGLIYASARDVTDEVESVDQIQQLNNDLRLRGEALNHQTKLADQANQAKSAFLAAMSHEIRTPMNGVIGMLELLHRSSLRGDQVEMVELIRESGQHLLRLINNILDFSKIEAGKLEVEQRCFDLPPLVESVCISASQAANSGEELMLSLYLDPDLPDQLIGDPMRIRQVLTNLLSNAFRFSGQTGRAGHVRLRIELMRRVDQTVEVRFTVSDNGIGMDEATQTRVFEAFRQAEAGTSSQYGGTGLGLAICRGLVKAMGGTISLQSVPDQGTTFCVELAFNALAEAPLSADRYADLRGLRCVLVGDFNQTVDDIERCLHHAGAAVRQIAADHWPQCLKDPAVVDPSIGIDRASLSTVCSQRSDLRVLCVGSGRQQTPQQVKGVLEVGGYGLLGKRMADAVAVAAGRFCLIGALSSDETELATLVPPNRAKSEAAGQLILVAEDNQINRALISQQLDKLGFVADLVTNGEEALSRWRQGRYGLILTDLQMPVRDGYQLTKAIRGEEQEGKHTPIIALSANALIGEAERCRALGMDDYLSKPASLNELETTLRRWLPSAVEQLEGQTADDLAPPSSSGPHADPASALDLQVLMDLIGDEPALLAGFVDDFRRTAERLGRTVNEAHRDGKLVELGQAAHTLKSLAHSFGAGALAAICAAIEKQSVDPANDPPRLTDQLARFRHELDRTLAAIDSLPQPIRPIKVAES